MVTKDEIRKYLQEQYGIESDAQLREELSKISFDIGMFVEVSK